MMGEPCPCTFDTVYDAAYGYLMNMDDGSKHIFDPIFSNFYVSDYYDIPLFATDPIAIVFEVYTFALVRQIMHLSSGSSIFS